MGEQRNEIVEEGNNNPHFPTPQGPPLVDTASSSSSSCQQDDDQNPNNGQWINKIPPRNPNHQPNVNMNVQPNPRKPPVAYQHAFHPNDESEEYASSESQSYS